MTSFSGFRRDLRLYGSGRAYRARRPRGRSFRSISWMTTRRSIARWARASRWWPPPQPGNARPAPASTRLAADPETSAGAEAVELAEAGAGAAGAARVHCLPCHYEPWWRRNAECGCAKTLDLVKAWYAITARRRARSPPGLGSLQDLHAHLARPATACRRPAEPRFQVPHSTPAPEERPDSDRLELTWGLLPTKPDWAGLSRRMDPGAKPARRSGWRISFPRLPPMISTRNLPSDRGKFAPFAASAFRRDIARHGLGTSVARARRAIRRPSWKELAWRGLCAECDPAISRLWLEEWARGARYASLAYRQRSAGGSRSMAGAAPAIRSSMRRMRQLWAAGWMHNRVRMIAASFLIKHHLLIDWRRVRRWFWDTLVDADYGNNSVNWQCTAGTGVDSEHVRADHGATHPIDEIHAADYIRLLLGNGCPRLAQLPECGDPRSGCRGMPVTTPIRPKIIGHRGGAGTRPGGGESGAVTATRNRFPAIRSGCMRAA